MVSSEKKTAWLMSCGSFLIVTGAVLIIFWPAIFFSQLKRMMILSETSASYEIWRDIPIPMYLECFMFNISNVDDILSGKDVKLRVEQLGPYVYRETHSKKNITWNDNSTVTYYNERFWHYVPEMSNGSLSDNITSINPIVVTVAYFMRHSHPFIKIPVDVFMRTFHENMFLTANVSSWLFDGIDDPILDIVAQFPELPINIPYDKFGWFYDRNGSMEFDGVFVMNTGASDFSELGNIQLWRHSNRTLYRDECGEVKGSTGELWAPELGQPEVTIFAPDVCTYLTLSKDSDVVIKDIEGVKYAANDSIFDNGYNYPDKACYCDEIRDENCMPPGALNVSACRFGAPAFVSLPHFYGMDPHYAVKIDGLEPNEDMNFQLALEMFTGMPLSVSAQLQINLLVRHVGQITINNQLPDEDTLVPMFWFRQEVVTTDEYADMARFALNVRYGIPYGLYALTVIGVLVIVGGVYVLLKKLLRSPETTPILQESTNDLSTEAQ